MRDQKLVAADAGRVLHDPVYAQSFEAVERTIIDALKSSPIESKSDVDRVLKLVMRLQSVSGSKRWLDNQMQMGMIAREPEKELRKKGLLNRGGL